MIDWLFYKQILMSGVIFELKMKFSTVSSSINIFIWPIFWNVWIKYALIVLCLNFYATIMKWLHNILFLVMELNGLKLWVFIKKKTYCFLLDFTIHFFKFFNNEILTLKQNKICYAISAWNVILNRKTNWLKGNNWL